VLAEAEAALDDVRLAAAGQIGRLTIGFTGSAINGTFGEALGRVRRTLPRVDLRLVDLLDDVDLSVQLLDGRLDVVVCRLPLHDARLTAEVWNTEPLSLFLPANHPLTTIGDRVPVSALADVTLLIWPRETAPASYDEVLAICQQAGIVPRFGVQGRTVQTLLALVAAGFGATVMADSYRVLRREGVAARRLAGTSTALHLVRRAGTTDPVLTRFLTALQDVRPSPAAPAN
jgi:DNA-binding transcriptional LysR family regulator